MVRLLYEFSPTVYVLPDETWKNLLNLISTIKNELAWAWVALGGMLPDFPQPFSGDLNHYSQLNTMM